MHLLDSLSHRTRYSLSENRSSFTVPNSDDRPNNLKILNFKYYNKFKRNIRISKLIRSSIRSEYYSILFYSKGGGGARPVEPTWCLFKFILLFLFRLIIIY